MPREIDELIESWRDEAYPRIVQAGDLRRVAAELEQLREERGLARRERDSIPPHRYRRLRQNPRNRRSVC